MKVALAQTSIIWENKNRNLHKAVELVSKAKSKGAEIVLFPEMSLTGFSMNVQITAEYNMETIKNIIQLAKTNKIAIGVGWTKGTNDKAENHYTIINRNGETLSDYVKIHPFSYAHEDQYFQSGKRIIFFEFGGYTWSNFICYDLRFPEIFQLASEKAEIIIVPANWPVNREEHWEILLKARAIENQCYVLGINCVGNIGEIQYNGSSMAISPRGEVLAKGKNRESLIFVDIEDNVKFIRDNFPVRKDKKKFDMPISSHSLKDEKYMGEIYCETECNNCWYTF